MPFPWRVPQMQNSNTLTDPKPNKNPFFPQSPNPLAAIFSNPTAASFKTQLDSAIQTLSSQTRRVLQLSFLNPSILPNGIPSFARISPPGIGGRRRAMTVEAIEERLSGVPVYTLSNAAEEFVLVSGIRAEGSLGLFCFKQEDAETLLDQMKAMKKDMSEGSKVVAVALNKVFQLKVDGVAFRLIPDPKQVLNAIKLKEESRKAADDFLGVPVFQSKSLVLRSQGKSYRPAFFRKEDLEDLLFKASRDQRQLNPAFRKGNIEVSVLEEIISAMKGSSASDWDDVVFIPPGFEVATAFREEAQTSQTISS
ncbi:protein TIC 22-like, chloroplastic [Phalaenopsis equestris]|uniref:protein TIC 22-like, chloroplastic n=1 Tax=Phalaenopsis equestris TaxID=78828 RepID=UPI0009E54EFA|nr:protein TIC 22-like, chloroplastic [Phalaenopsis equestris]